MLYAAERIGEDAFLRLTQGIFILTQEGETITVQKKNLIIILVANFLVNGSATMVLPFLPLFITTFGNFSDAYVQRTSGFVYATTFLVAIIVAPFWGRFGDTYGRKKLLIISATGVGIAITLMAFASSIAEVLIYRAIHGLFTGFIPIASVFISAQTAKDKLGSTLGTIQIGAIAGALCGPLLGGILADNFGYSQTFMITGICIMLAAPIIAIGTKEVRIPDEDEDITIYSRKEVLILIAKNPLIVVLLIVILIKSVANLSIQPLLALYIRELTLAQNLAFLAGLTFSITGLGSLIATKSWGALGDRIGHGKVILILLFASGIVFIPQAFVTELWQLITIRFFYGLVMGGFGTCTAAYIRYLVPYSALGEVLGYVQSVNFAGNVIGPIIGGIVAGFVGIPLVFCFAGLTSIICGGIFWLPYSWGQKADINKETRNHTGIP